MKSAHAIIIGACFLFWACTEAPPEQLPAITSHGLETFGCKVNGNIWLPKPQSNPFFAIGGDLSFSPNPADDSNVWILTNDFKTNPNTSFNIQFFHGNRLGDVRDTDISFGYPPDNSKEGQVGFAFSNRKKDLVHIHLLRSDWRHDTISVAGIFNGTLFNGKGAIGRCQDSIVTNKTHSSAFGVGLGLPSGLNLTFNQKITPGILLSISAGYILLGYSLSIESGVQLGGTSSLKIRYTVLQGKYDGHELNSKVVSIFYQSFNFDTSPFFWGAGITLGFGDTVLPFAEIGIRLFSF